MIIDAMDILHSEKVDGFCLVSSDSDFTRLATRLRESGMLVLGMGEKKTPKPFIVACDKFIYIEVLGEDSEQEANNNSLSTIEKKKGKSKEKEKSSIDTIGSNVVRFIRQTVNDVADDNGWPPWQKSGV